MHKTVFEGRKVFPGDKITVVELASEGQGTYESEGVIRSAEIGEAHFDIDERKAIVEKRTKQLILPVEGLNVIAEVGSVMRRDARVDVFMIDGKILFTPFTGVIHVSSVSNNYVRDMGRIVRGTDIVKAKIINVKNRMNQLSLMGPEYGVVYAYCARCGSLLKLQKDRLRCSKCGRVERRKISNNYGKEELV